MVESVIIQNLQFQIHNAGCLSKNSVVTDDNGQGSFILYSDVALTFDKRTKVDLVYDAGVNSVTESAEVTFKADGWKISLTSDEVLQYPTLTATLESCAGSTAPLSGRNITFTTSLGKFIDESQSILINVSVLVGAALVAAAVYLLVDFIKDKTMFSLIDYVFIVFLLGILALIILISAATSFGIFSVLKVIFLPKKE